MMEFKTRIKKVMVGAKKSKKVEPESESNI